MNNIAGAVCCWRFPGPFSTAVARWFSGGGGRGEDDEEKTRGKPILYFASENIKKILDGKAIVVAIE